MRCSVSSHGNSSGLLHARETHLGLQHALGRDVDGWPHFRRHNQGLARPEKRIDDVARFACQVALDGRTRVRNRARQRRAVLARLCVNVCGTQHTRQAPRSPTCCREGDDLTGDVSIAHGGGPGPERAAARTPHTTVCRCARSSAVKRRSERHTTLKPACGDEREWQLHTFTFPRGQ